MTIAHYSYKEIVITLVILLLIVAFSTTKALSESAIDYPENDKEVTRGALDLAGITFPIDKVKQDGRYVDMVITENARGLREASTAYEISAMKKVTARNPETCPMVNSTAIDKNVKNYNPFTGRASMKITFVTVAMAKEVAKADCLLIYDTETEPYSDY